MSVQALAPDYKFEARDLQKNFHGNQLLYIGWDHHLMFCSAFTFPVPGEMTFAELKDTVMSGAFSQHPMYADIDWNATTWLLNGEKFQPQPDVALKDQGIGHKAVLRFQTPDNGYQNAGI